MTELSSLAPEIVSFFRQTPVFPIAVVVVAVLGVLAIVEDLLPVP